MTPEELEEAIEAGGAQIFELVKAIFDPDEETSRASQILSEMMDTTMTAVDLAGKVQDQPKAAVISRILVGAMDRADDEYLPLSPATPAP